MNIKCKTCDFLFYYSEDELNHRSNEEGSDFVEGFIECPNCEESEWLSGWGEELEFEESKLFEVVE